MLDGEIMAKTKILYLCFNQLFDRLLQRLLHLADANRMGSASDAANNQLLGKEMGFARPPATMCAKVSSICH